jgi:hypothetical protein
MGNGPMGVRALVIFFAFGATMSGLAFASLLFPGSVLEPIWQLNPSAREALSKLGIYAAGLMGVVCVACSLSAVGLLRQSRQGYLLAIAVLTINIIADAVNAIVRNDWRALIGIPVGGLLVAYLVTPKVRRLFVKHSDA